jgi:ubiquinone/menaquinone biosynthesis C-methylase UbiE
MPFDHFDLIAGLYNHVAQFTISAQMLDLFALPSGGMLLDVGGGTGRVAEAFRGMVRDVVVVDLSKGMLHHAVNKGLPAVCAPAEKLPFPSGSIERIIMVDALHHVIDQGRTVNELWRLLIPGGRILIIEPDIRKFSIQLIAAGEKLLLMRSHFLSSERIAALFSDLHAEVGVATDESNVWVSAKK